MPGFILRYLPNDFPYRYSFFKRSDSERRPTSCNMTASVLPMLSEEAIARLCRSQSSPDSREHGGTLRPCQLCQAVLTESVYDNDLFVLGSLVHSGLQTAPKCLHRIVGWDYYGNRQETFPCLVLGFRESTLHNLLKILCRL